MFKYGRMQENSTLVSVWLPWCMPRLHVTWGVTAGLGFFLHSSRLSASDDSDSPVVMRCIPAISGNGSKSHIFHSYVADASILKVR